MQNYLPKLVKKKKMREKERFWTWNMKKFSLFHDDMKTF